MGWNTPTTRYGELVVANMPGAEIGKFCVWVFDETEVLNVSGSEPEKVIVTDGKWWIVTNVDTR